MPDRLTGRTLVIATGHHLSLALLDGSTLLGRHDEAIGQGHAEQLMPAIAVLLGGSGDQVVPCGNLVVEIGPGSFTGLRIGFAAASALALVWQARFLGIRSTQLVAARCRGLGMKGALRVALRAPRGQIWTEDFAGGSVAEGQGVRAVLASDAGALREDGWTIVGSGATCIDADAAQFVPEAAVVAGLAASEFGPAKLLYIRPEEPCA